VRAGQELKHDRRPIAHNRRAGAIEHRALGAFDVRFDESHIRKAELVQRADLHLIPVHAGKKPRVALVEAAGEMQGNPLP